MANLRFRLINHSYRVLLVIYLLIRLYQRRQAGSQDTIEVSVGVCCVLKQMGDGTMVLVPKHVDNVTVVE